MLVAFGIIKVKQVNSLLLGKKGHIRNANNFPYGSCIANHVWLSNHPIDFENARAIDEGDYRMLEPFSCHAATTAEAGNYSKPLPIQCSFISMFSSVL